MECRICQMALPSRSAILASLSALLLVGCGPSAPKPEPPPTEGPLPSPAKSNVEPEKTPVREDAKSAAEKMASPDSIPDPKPVTPSGSGGWRPSKTSVSDFASKLGAKLAQTNGTEGKANVGIKTPEGEGRLELRYLFATPTKYRIEYIEPYLVPSRALIISNGTLKVEFKNKKFGKPIPESSKFESGSASPSEWVRNFSRLLFARITDKRDTLAEFAKSLASDKNFVAGIEERTLERNGKKVLNFRLRGERTPAAAAKQGPLKLEIVVDGVRWMPVTIRTEAGSGKDLWRYEWSCGWNFGKTFPESEFVVRKETPQ